MERKTSLFLPTKLYFCYPYLEGSSHVNTQHCVSRLGTEHRTLYSTIELHYKHSPSMLFTKAFLSSLKDAFIFGRRHQLYQKVSQWLYFIKEDQEIVYMKCFLLAFNSYTAFASQQQVIAQETLKRFYPCCGFPMDIYILNF